MLTDKTQIQAKEIVELLKSNNLKLATAESCTGGLVSAYLTSISGSSSVFERGFVTYSNQSKIDLLTVPTMYIKKFGAVSKETAMAMAEGALIISEADIAIAITGIAGPDSDGSDKAVGGVYFAIAKKNFATKHFYKIFDGDRNQVREKSVQNSFNIIKESIVK